MIWKCPRCRRSFRRSNQTHRCGVGSTQTLFKNRAPALEQLYRELEAAVRNFGDVEIVAHDRYALFRTTRIFTDLTVTMDALRVVVHLARKADRPYFIKIGPVGRRILHVALVRTHRELHSILPLVREAFDLASNIPQRAIVPSSTRKSTRS
jgi:hypothetical protein